MGGGRRGKARPLTTASTIGDLLCDGTWHRGGHSSLSGGVHHARSLPHAQQSLSAFRQQNGRLEWRMRFPAPAVVVAVQRPRARSLTSAFFGTTLDRQKSPSQVCETHSYDIILLVLSKTPVRIHTKRKARGNEACCIFACVPLKRCEVGGKAPNRRFSRFAARHAVKRTISISTIRTIAYHAKAAPTGYKRIGRSK